jgi:hypothetical protein
MTWREFRLKLCGFRRQEKENWSRTRSIAYMSYLAIPEKGAKKTIDQFWPLNAKSTKVTTTQKELLLQAHKKAMEEAKKMKV